MGAIHEGTHGLQIHIPPAIGHVVGMANLMPELRTFAANFTNSCHLKETPGLDFSALAILT